LGQAKVVEFSARQGRTEFANILQTLDSNRDRLVFYVRPSGITHFEKCLELAKARAFSVGYDAAEENRQYVLSTP